ncbi:MAG: dUTP diphosphatase [Synergistales bacterium]|nr:dUTP diphosphatase [Synergistales bacterium]
MAEKIHVKVVRAGLARDHELPSYETRQSAGVDLKAAEQILLQPGKYALVSTGLSIELPQGYEAQIRPRSGLALRKGITVLNSPGTIDADYRGEIKVILINLGPEPFEIYPGDRIAQMIVSPVVQLQWLETDLLNETSRGQGGFGSTGI